MTTRKSYRERRKALGLITSMYGSNAEADCNTPILNRVAERTCSLSETDSKRR